MMDYYQNVVGVGGIGHLFESRHLFSFGTLRMGAYLKWELIQINTVLS